MEEIKPKSDPIPLAQPLRILCELNQLKKHQGNILGIYLVFWF